MKNLSALLGKTLLTILFLSSTITKSQTKKTYLSKETFTEQLNNIPEDDYQKRISFIETSSNENDTLYVDLLIALSYYCIQNEDYKKAITYCDKGIGLKFHNEYPTFYGNKASALLNLKKYDEMLIVADEGLKSYPKNAKLNYIKALAYEGKKNYKEAIKYNQLAIKLNPFNATYHYKLGEFSYRADMVTQAALCYSMYLILDPDGENAITVLSALNTIVTSKNETERINVNNFEDAKAFEQLDKLVKNYVALNKKYKSPSKIDLPYVKQTHLILNSLKDLPKTDGFWGTYYIPFFQQIIDNGMFEDFIYTISFSISDESKYKSVVLKNKQNVIDFVGTFFAVWNKIISEKKLDNGEIEKYYYHNNDYVNAIGKMKGDKMIGVWRTYDKQGVLFSEGAVDNDNKKTGEWTFYHPNKQINELAFFKGGNLEGEYKYYYENGILGGISNYKEGKIVGEYTNYNKKGAPTETGMYNDENIITNQTFYYDIGKEFLNYKVIYKDGKIDGLIKILYEDGSLKSEINFTNGKRNGQEKEYYKSGKLKAEYTNLDNLMNGDYISYYENGEINSQGKYKDGIQIGDWVYYNKYGEKTEEMFYDEKGKKTGIYKQYDIDGILFNEIDYKNGNPIAYHFFDKNGAVLKDVKKSKGSFIYEGFYADGVNSSKGNYLLEDGKDGKWEYFDINGNLHSVEYFSKGKLVGDETFYFTDGKLKTEMSYKNDSLSGYYVDYYSNGNINFQGWYENDNRTGEWNYYYSDTTLKETYYFINGKLNGKQYYYSPKGKLYMTQEYHLGDILNTTFYDTLENVYQVLNEDTASENLVLKQFFPNGNIKKETSYKYGVAHGPFTNYFQNGTVQSTGQYINDKREGVWKWYYPDGKLSYEGTYYQNEKHGEWKNYDDDGKLDNKKNFEYGLLEGETFYYSPSGNITQKEFYRNDELHGEKIFYDEHNNLQLIRHYWNGKLTGYSYLGKDGEKIPEIKLENETGEITAYYKNGQISRKMKLDKGMFVGNYDEYYYNGQLKEREFFENGERQGEVKSYYESGKLKSVRHYELGNSHNLYTEYYENQKIKKTTSYYDGEYNGWIRKYDPSGKLLYETYYINNYIIY